MFISNVHQFSCVNVTSEKSHLKIYNVLHIFTCKYIRFIHLIINTAVVNSYAYLRMLIHILLSITYMHPFNVYCIYNVQLNSATHIHKSSMEMYYLVSYITPYKYNALKNLPACIFIDWFYLLIPTRLHKYIHITLTLRTTVD